MRQYMRQQPIEGGPQFHQVAPGSGLEMLNADATNLIVARPPQFFFEKSAHEALMIVGSRIDQMAQHLFARPSSRYDWFGSFGICEHSELAFSASNQFFQL